MKMSCEEKAMENLTISLENTEDAVAKVGEKSFTTAPTANVSMNWMREANNMLILRVAGVSEQEQAARFDELMQCRKELLDSGLFTKPSHVNILQQTLHKIRRSRDMIHLRLLIDRKKKSPSSLAEVASKMRTDIQNKKNTKRIIPSKEPKIPPIKYSEELKSQFWQTSRYPITEPLFVHSVRMNDRRSIKMFNKLLQLAHDTRKLNKEYHEVDPWEFDLESDSERNSPNQTSDKSSDDSSSEDENKNRWINLHFLNSSGKSPIGFLRGIQELLEIALSKPDLATELFCQLIKQTMDSPDPNGFINLSYWKIFCSLCNLIAPVHKCLLAYTKAHFKRCAADCRTDEGRYAIFSAKSLNRTIEKGPRLLPMSIHELNAITLKKTFQLRIRWPDCTRTKVECNSHTTIEDIFKNTLNNSKIPASSYGWAIYEKVGSEIRCPQLSSRAGNLLYRWERYSKKNSTKFNFGLLMKKRLFSRMLNTNSKEEVHQVVYQTAERIFQNALALPNEIKDLTELCALYAVCECASRLISQTTMKRYNYKRKKRRSNSSNNSKKLNSYTSEQSDEDNISNASCNRSSTGNHNENGSTIFTIFNFDPKKVTRELPRRSVLSSADLKNKILEEACWASLRIVPQEIRNEIDLDELKEKSSNYWKDWEEKTIDELNAKSEPHNLNLLVAPIIASNPYRKGSRSNRSLKESFDETFEVELAIKHKAGLKFLEIAQTSKDYGYSDFQANSILTETITTNVISIGAKKILFKDKKNLVLGKKYNKVVSLLMPNATEIHLTTISKPKVIIIQSKQIMEIFCLIRDNLNDYREYGQYSTMASTSSSSQPSFNFDLTSTMEVRNQSTRQDIESFSPLVKDIDINDLFGEDNEQADEESVILANGFDEDRGQISSEELYHHSQTFSENYLNDVEQLYISDNLLTSSSDSIYHARRRSSQLKPTKVATFQYNEQSRKKEEGSSFFI